MTAWLALLRALLEGQELANVATWKNRAAAMAIISAVLAAAVALAVNRGWIPADLVTQQAIMEVSGVLVTIVNLILGYLSIATSKKVGFRPRDESDADGMRDTELSGGAGNYGASGSNNTGDERGGFTPQ